MNTAIAKVEDEHGKLVFERYKMRSNSFRKLLIGLVGLSLAFYFFIIFPYVSIQSKNYRIAEQLRNLPDKIKHQQKLVKAYEAVQNGIESLHDEIDNFPQKLRGFILLLEKKEIRQERGFPVQQMRQQMQQQHSLNQDSCDSLQDEEWVNCKVRKEVLSQFDNYSRILNEEVVSPLETVGGKAISIINRDKLKNQLNELQKSFEMKLTQNPRFWKTFSDKTGFSVELTEEVNNFWREYDPIVKTETVKLEKELEKHKKEKDKLEKERSDLKAKNSELTKRLSTIQSPLGNFPVGLNDSVLLFPVAVAIGFLVCTFLFIETLCLRKAFHKLYQNKSQVILIAPLWIDPVNPEQNKPLRLTILFSPIAFFAGAIVLNFYIRTISDNLTGAGQFNWWVYIGLYILSLGGVIYGCRQIRTELRRYPGE
ncbi:MAG: hypothetical protein ACYSTS_19535 [Planctomycetota bacterium]|jgi:hypothetical protein